MGLRIDELVDYDALYVSVKNQATRVAGPGNWPIFVAQPYLGQMARGEKVDRVPFVFQDIVRECMTNVPISARYETPSRFAVVFNLTHVRADMNVKLLFARSAMFGGS
jgi:hypothetical protein